MANDNTENVQYDKKKENTNPAFQVLCLFAYHCASENGLLLPNCIPLQGPRYRGPGGPWPPNF